MARHASSLLLCVTLVLAWTGAGAQPSGPTGSITGVVLDKASGDPVIEAGVEVVGTGRTTRTDLDGRYRVALPPGTYEVRVFAPGYQGSRITKVTVAAGGSTKADTALAAAGAAGMDVVEVVAQANKAAEATQLLKRQRATVVSDNVSGETIAKSPDSNAAEVVQRVPAVTVKDQKFIVVRGLGERYSSAILNGSRLPSTDPLKRVVPLDLFPADFIDSLSVVKSYSPELPGDFSGGLANLELREFPDTLAVRLGLNTSANTATTFKKFSTYNGSRYDYFGFGSAVRALPDGGVQVDTPFPRQPSLIAATGRDLRNIWDVESTTAPPNAGIAFSAGNSWGPFGAEIAGLYSTEYASRRDEVSRSYTSAAGGGQGATDELVPQDDFRYDTSEFHTHLGGVFTAAYKLGPDHKLTLRSLIDRNSVDEVRIGTGFAAQFGTNQEISQRRYTADELDFGQLGGEHRWSWLEIDWRSALARSLHDTPDTRNLTYDLGAPAAPHAPQFQNDAVGGYRVWGALHEIMTDSAVDFTVPFRTWLPFTDLWSGLPGRFRFGPAYAYRDRTYDLLLLRYNCVSCTTVDRELPPEVLLAPADLGRAVQLQDQTKQTDLFQATQEIAAGYALLDLPLVRDRLRVIGGVRMEYSLIRVGTADFNTQEPLLVRKKNVDLLPGVNLVWTPRRDMNVRGGYSQTVSRPEFRELSPALFPEPRTFRSLIGDPTLVQSAIENWDARWEWFFAPGELVSLGLFYKTIDQPIEVKAQPNGSDLLDQFSNATKATLKGFEVEGRKNFGFLSPHLAGLSLQASVAYVKSTATLPREGTDQQTNTERPLQGQSPFIVNAALEYQHPRWGTARLLYNTAGRRIVTAGAARLPDFYEERRDQLDAVVIFPLKELGLPLTLKLAAENLFNDPTRVTLGENLQRKYTTGTKFSLGLSYSF